MIRSTRKLLATATASRKPLAPFLLERFDGWNDSTLSLSSSECEPLSLKELLQFADDEGLQRWESLSLGYVEPSNGSAYLRQEIIRAQFLDNKHHHNALALSEDNVNVCAPQEGIFLAIHALCQPGDHIVCVAPAYQSLHEIARSLGCEVSLWWPEEMEVNGHKSMHFSPATLQKLVRPKQTKMVIANFPHNPTGALPTPDEFATMVDIVQNDCDDAWFLVDEMYRGLEHQGSDHRLPTIASVMSRGISLGGVSKSYGLPGLRIGWLVNGDNSDNVTTNFHKRVSELKDYTTICPPAPSEALAFIALRAQDKLWQQSRDIVADGLAKLRQFVTVTTLQQDRYQFEWCEPRGGTFGWVKFNSSDDTDMTASDYCQGVRQRTGLMMVPSGLFPECVSSDDRIRMTYGKMGIDHLLQLLERDLLLQGDP